MRIKVNSVSPVTKEKSYDYFTLDYSKDGKDEKPKKIMSFSEAAYATLKGAASGDSFDVGLEKDANGYWQWKNVTAVQAGSPDTPGTSTGKSGNWESAEERARRQVLIVRQSCLAQAIALKGQGTLDEQILKTAEVFEQHILRD